MKKLTLLVLASTFPRWNNDKEPRFVYDLCQGLKDEFEVIVLTSHFSGAKTYEELNGLKVIRYRYAPACFERLVYDGGIATNLKKNKTKFLLVPFFFISQFFSIIKLSRKHSISVIHAHWLIPQGFLALLAMKVLKYSPKLLCTSHGGDLFGLNDPLNIKIKKWVIQNSDAITVVSSAMQKKVLELSPQAKDQLSILPMGTDLTHTFYSTPDIIRKKNLLIFAGRLVEKKGVDTLLYALAQLIKQFSELKLVIIGDGPEKKQLKKLSIDLSINHAIQFIGKLSHPELATWFSKASIAVFPFKEAKNKDVEGLGLVMIEALGCQCPVIAGDVPAVHDVISDNNTGLIFKSGSSKELTKKINDLLLNPLKALKLSKAGQNHVKENFSQNRISKKYTQLIYSILEKKYKKLQTP